MTDDRYSAPRPDEGSEPESCETFRATQVVVRMSGENEHDLEADALTLGSYIAGLFEVPGFTVTPGTGVWRGTVEHARVIEVVHAGLMVKADMEGIRAQALRLGYTVFVTILDITAAEVF